MTHHKLQTASLVFVYTLVLSGLSHARGGVGHHEWNAAIQWTTLDTPPPIARRPLVDDIVEYRVDLRVGPGDYDVIGLHRVVREVAPWQPIETPDAVMLVHGSASTFQTAFAPALVDAELFAPEHGLAPYLAASDIDVWGIDLRWTFVPMGATDFSDLAEWNLESQIKDLRLAARIARLVRWIGGSGYDPLFFAGHSSGGTLTYAYANADTQRPRWQRDVRGLIPIEITFKLTSPESEPLREAAATRCAAYQGLYDSGQYALTLGAQLAPLVGLGLSVPDDPSPVVPGFTNLQTATAIYSLTHLFYAPLPAYTQSYHFLAGTFDEQTGLPTGFQFVDQFNALAITAYFPPYQSLIDAIELEALLSGVVDLPYDDHLGEIDAPVFYVGATGGFGAWGEETLELLGSTDRSSLIVQLYPNGYEAIDFGHVDTLWADAAPDLVWAPIRDFIHGE